MLGCAVSLLLLPESHSDAHETRPAYLEIRAVSVDAFVVLWRVPLQLGRERSSLELRFAPDVNEVRKSSAALRGDAYVQRMRIKRSGGLVGLRIAVRGLAEAHTNVLLRLVDLEGRETIGRLTPVASSHVVGAEPSRGEVAWTYLVLGVEHILYGIDHLLFVLALLMLISNWRTLLGTVTAFTIAHSVTLGLATLGFVHVPGAPVEAVIALSIVLVAAEAVHVRGGHRGLTARSPWVVAFAFGLLHGFGFAGALAEVGLPTTSIPLALLTFNIGVEAGQLLFVAAVLVLYALGKPERDALPEWLCRLPAYAVGSLAAFWTIERVAGF